MDLYNISILESPEREMEGLDEPLEQPDGQDDGQGEPEEQPQEEDQNLPGTADEGGKDQVEEPQPTGEQEASPDAALGDGQSPEQEQSPQEETKGESPEAQIHDDGGLPQDGPHIDMEGTEYQQPHERQEEGKQKHFFDSIDTEEFVMPSVFDVEIKLADNQIKIVTVEVEKAMRDKPYIGGYVNK